MKISQEGVGTAQLVKPWTVISYSTVKISQEGLGQLSWYSHGLWSESYSTVKISQEGVGTVQLVKPWTVIREL